MTQLDPRSGSGRRQRGLFSESFTGPAEGAGPMLTHEELQRYLEGGRRLQADAMVRALASLAGATRQAIGGLCAALRRSRQRQRALRALEALDDHLLRDIGLRRDQIRMAAAGLLNERRVAAAVQPSADLRSAAAAPLDSELTREAANEPKQGLAA